MKSAVLMTGALSTLTAIDVGVQNTNTLVFTDPLERGQTIPLNGIDYDVIAGGHDIWDNADGFHFAYEMKTGDFDLQVRVARLDIANNWSKAGIMVREKLTAASRNLSCVVDPKGPPAAS